MGRLFIKVVAELAINSCTLQLRFQTSLSQPLPLKQHLNSPFPNMIPIGVGVGVCVCERERERGRISLLDSVCLWRMCILLL